MKQPSQGLPQPSSHSSGSALSQECYSALYGAPGTPSALCSSSPAAAFFSDLDEGVLSRADNMGLLEMDKDGSTTHQLLKPQDFYRHTSSFTLAGQDGTPMTQLPALTNHFVLGSESDLTFETLASNSSPGMCAGTSAIDYHRYLPQNMAIASSAAHDLTGYSAEGHGQIYSSMYSSSPHPVVVSSHQHLPPSHPPNAHLYSAHPAHHSQQSQDPYKNDCDPLELERFAEMFKQRRIKLGVTQADVGSALAELRIPGVGSLSQSTICRFESLTLSHNNMIALKPILLTWLEEAEQRAYERRAQQQQQQLEEKKRKRTSITAPEKRSLEAYFAVQPRPSGDKIAQIAEKLDLRKNVVRVWFCNQRQKQKRLKFSATAVGHH